MTTDNETWEVRSKNTSAMTSNRHRCRERQRNENLPDYNFIDVVFCLSHKVFTPSLSCPLWDNTVRWSASFLCVSCRLHVFIVSFNVFSSLWFASIPIWSERCKTTSTCSEFCGLCSEHHIWQRFANAQLLTVYVQKREQLPRASNHKRKRPHLNAECRRATWLYETKLRVNMPLCKWRVSVCFWKWPEKRRTQLKQRK